MKHFTGLAAAAALMLPLVCAFASPRRSSFIPADYSQIRQASRMTESAGCNANVCFALDGSGSISNQGFQNQKDFVIDVSAIINPNPCKLSALVYGSNVTLISPLTDDIDRFLVAVNSARFDSSSSTSIDDGILQCAAQLEVGDERRAVIVLLGDGRFNSGSDPIRLAGDFKNDFGDGAALHTVGADFFDIDNLRGIASAGGGRTFEVESFEDVLTLTELIVGENSIA